MEFVIVDAAGGNSGKTSYPDLKKYAEKKGFTPLQLGQVILSNAGLKKGTGVNRMSVTPPSVSSAWHSNRPNKTPKTDIIINSKKFRVSKCNATYIIIIYFFSNSINRKIITM